jgi:cupin 2 domain-containing protein
MSGLVAGLFFEGAAAPGTGERFEDIGSIGGVRIERIVSSDCPDTAWQAQAWDEWVMLVHGRAELEVIGQQGEVEAVVLSGGGWLFIPAHKRHRVVTTEAGSIWLALHASSVGS